MKTGLAARRPIPSRRAPRGSRRGPCAPRRPVSSRLLLCLPILLLAAPAPAAGWDIVGHQVTARIAWEHMTEAARAGAVEMLLAASPDARIADLMPRQATDPELRNRAFFQWAAAWGDLIRRPDHPAHRHDRPAWHHTDVFWRNENGHAVPLDLPPAGEAVARLEYYRCILGAGSGPAAAADSGTAAAAPSGEPGVHLAWLLHIAGDLHQPLHAASRVTDREPRGDRGGNAFQLADGEDLHRLWDRILSSTGDRRAGESADAFPGRIAGLLMAMHPRAELEDRVAIRDPRAWAEESAEIARTLVYLPELRRGEAPPPEYREHAFRVSAERAALAGYRIAAWLNRLFDPLADPPEEGYGPDRQRRDEHGTAAGSEGCTPIVKGLE